ncbi:pre-rRNA-processing protein TSR2 homolog [Petromyzon marinus]|uniref:Pre-rRNA-processing protein TSR2 homolog n=1 Tax=Petromyzon marinus TaxID=7757 RepID=A0AAJ7X5V0_PETMA|nr:pre-rRNA-processing protein TSR2 homolog [Petromyzon marinus]
MAAPSRQGASRVPPCALFHSAVGTVLKAWPVLQIAVENGFGGVYSQQKAEWMVGVVESFFYENGNLESFEVEDFLTDIVNNEFDTVIEDDSLPQVSRQLCTLFGLCTGGRASEATQFMETLSQKSFNHKLNVTRVGDSDDDDDDNDDSGGTNDEAMDCAEAAQPPPSSGEVAQPSVPSSTESQRRAEPGEDGWTTVQRRRR